MTLVSHKKKFIYIKNAKVAGTSIEAYFDKYCIPFEKDYKQNHSVSFKESKYGIRTGRLTLDITPLINHSSAIDIKKYIGDNKFNSYLKFCVIRNPYDKMVSYYFFLKKWKKEHNLTFKEFCKEYHCKNIERYSIDGDSCIDFYIRFEYLLEDLEKLCKILEIEFKKEELQYYKSEFREKRPYQDFYDEETRKIVYNSHKEEFKKFNYKF